MIAVLALAAAAVLTPDEKEPLALIVTAPAGETRAISSSELIGAVDETLDRYTDLAAKLAAPELVDECGGAIDCLAARARGEFKDARLLLVLSVLPSASGDSAAALLIDLQTAAELAPLARVAVAGKKDAERFLTELFTKTFRAALEQRGHFEPYAEIALVNELAGATLRVDGEPNGVLAAGTTTLRLRSGPRTITVEAEGRAPWTSTIAVARGARSSIAAHLSPAIAEGSAPVRTAFLWTGAGLAASGAALTAFALLKHDSDVNSLCLYGAGGDRAQACGSGSRFVTSSYDAGAALGGRGLLNPSGVMLAPLGLALASCGLTWSLSMLLFDGNADPPLLELAIGLGAGVLTYSIAALANGTAAP